MANSTRRLVPALRALLATTRPDTDAALLTRFVSSKDEPAFAELMRRHGPMVLGVSRRVTRDAHAAEDVFQATFLLLARKAESIRRTDGLGAWLHRTAFRLAVRSRKGRQEPPPSCPPRPAIPSPLDTLTAREMLAILDEELARLSDEHRAAVVLCTLEGLSQDEAARRLGWTTDSVRGRLERGRARLRQRLEERGLTLPSAMVGPLCATGSLPGGLLEAARAAVFDGTANPTVLALVEGGVSAMSATKLGLVGAMALLCGMLALGAALRDDPPPEKAPPPPPAAVKGDPLPEGVRLRLGDVERRAFGTKVAVTADGKSIHVLRRIAECLTEYDTQTGAIRSQREIPNDLRGSHLWVMSPDGRWLVTNQRGKTPDETLIVVSDLRTYKRAATLSVKVSSYMVPLGTFSTDGTRLAVVGTEANKRRVYVWDWKAGKQLLAGEVDGNYWSHQVALSPDGRYALLLPGTVKGGICCWEVATGKQLWTTPGTSSRGVTITPQGKVLSDEAAGTLVERDLRTGEKTKTLRLPPIDTMHYVTLLQDGKRLAESGPKGVNVWDLGTGANVGRFLGTTWAEVYATPDGKSIVTNDGTLQRWDLATGKPAYPDETRKGHLDEVTSLVFSADGRRLASASRDGAVGVWDTGTGRPTHLSRLHYPRRTYPHDQGQTHGGVEAIDLTADGRWVASADNFEACRVVDAVAGKVVRSFRLAEAGGPKDTNRVRHLRLDREGRTITGLLYPGFGLPEIKEPGKLVRWDVATGQPTTLGDVKELAPWTGAIDLHGRFFTCGGQVHDAQTGKPFADLADHEPRSDASFSRDGALIAGGATWRAWAKTGGPPSDLALRVWETLTGKVVARLASLPQPGEKALHPAGRFVAVNDMQAIRLYDLRSEKEVKAWPMPKEVSINGGAYRVSSFAFSPDGRVLATGHPDGTILLWDVVLPVEKPESLRPGELDALWKELGGEDARKAYLAAWRLAEFPAEAVPAIRDWLKPARSAPGEVTGPLIADLDGDTQAKRDEATKRLRELGHRAEPALREALKAPASAEQKRRLSQLLAALENPGTLTAEQLRDVRAVQVLGWIGTPEARKHLQALADGGANDPVTRQARSIVPHRR